VELIIQHQLREEDLPQNKDNRVDTTIDVHSIRQDGVHSTEADRRTDVGVVIDVVIRREVVDNLSRILVSIHYKKVGDMVVIDVVSFIVLECGVVLV